MKGYAVEVFFILAGNNLPSGVIVDSTLAIAIDDEVVATFYHDASNFSNYQYNQSIYSNSSMTNTNHTISVRTSGEVQSLILFDYLTYT